ncbi:unnamed protein product [Parajaminaea phylloscopi]
MNDAAASSSSSRSASPARNPSKRSRSESSTPGPAPPPPAGAAANSDSDDDSDIGPMPPPPAAATPGKAPGAKLKSEPEVKRQRIEEAKRQALLRHQSLYLDALPSAARYHQSFMHRAPINFVSVTPSTQFVITASIDGHVKFWKKQEVGIEFVKHYRAHLGVSTAAATSADGAMYATGGSDRAIKIFDVFNFDLINMIKLDYVPRTLCWLHRKGRAETILAAVPENSHAIHLYEGRGDGRPFAIVDSVHRKPVHLLGFNETANCVVSADEGGMVEYWRPEEPWEKPSTSALPELWGYKTATDLFDFKKTKTVPSSICFSPKYDRFAMRSLPDRCIRIFDFHTGKITMKIDESLATIQESIAAGTAGVRLDEMELGRRLAQDKQLDVDAKEVGAVNAAQGLWTENAVFDETGHFLIYPTMLGIKTYNTFTQETSRIMGNDESVRFLNVSLFQGVGGLEKKRTKSLALMASENPAAAAAAASARGGPDVADPTLFCTAFKRERFYLFTRLEPDEDEASGAAGASGKGSKNRKAAATSERDVFNEKPSREEQTIAAGSDYSGYGYRSGAGSGAGAGGRGDGAGSGSQHPTSLTLHTTQGDIHLRLFPEFAPKTVENFVGLSKKGYYDNLTFHRIIKKFMIQTGDPLGDGTGGESLWGGNFADELPPTTAGGGAGAGSKWPKHDRPYTLSMANAGPNTNGSQFFLTTVPTPWLDGKHTVFGRATAGMDVIHRIENVRVDSNDKPRDPVRILNVSIG